MAKVGLTQYSHDAGEPGQTVLIDAIGPYGGARHVTTKPRNSAIVIQDEFSRLVKIYPVEFVNSEHISVKEPRPDQDRGTATPKPGCTKQAMA